jgi:hypothetical protein
MQGASEIRRHDDGSIAIDFYRRRAVRHRRLVRRWMIARLLGMVVVKASWRSRLRAANRGIMPYRPKPREIACEQPLVAPR